MTPDTLSKQVAAHRRRSYFGSLRGWLFVCAFAMAMLPIPVTAFRWLPAYDLHSRFLVFYAPVVCLLLLAYLFYVRDIFARVMFADILRPVPERDPFDRETASDAARRWWRRSRASFLALLPALLLASSIYCLLRYTTRLRQSLETATATGKVWDSPEEVGVLRSPSAPRVPPGKTPFGVPAPSSAALPGTLATRGHALRAAGIDDIPLFTELTALYIGVFATAVAAFLVMALKEHAKQAMGLSEQALMLGEWRAMNAVNEEVPPLPPPRQ